MEYFVVGIVAFFASLLSFFSGFGLGTLLMPAFAFFLPVDEAISLTAVVHFLNNIIKFLLTRKEVDKAVFLQFGIPAIPAAFFGAYLLIYLSDMQQSISLNLSGYELAITPVNAIIGSLLVIFAVADLNKRMKSLSIKKKRLWIGGLLSGFFGGLSGHQGALRSLFLINSGLTKEGFVATSIAIALLVDIIRMSLYTTNYLKSGLQEHFSILLVAFLTAFAGAVGGRILLTKITIKSIRILVAILLVLIGIGLLLGII